MKSIIAIVLLLMAGSLFANQEDFYCWEHYKTVWHVELIKGNPKITPEKALEKRLNQISLNPKADWHEFQRIEDITAISNKDEPVVEHWFQLTWSEQVGYGRHFLPIPVNLIITQLPTPWHPSIYSTPSIKATIDAAYGVVSATPTRILK